MPVFCKRAYCTFALRFKDPNPQIMVQYPGKLICEGHHQLRKKEKSMLILKPNCECCDKNLPADSTDAMICSFECTFCASCMNEHFNNRCPNCGGDVSKRPTRRGELLKANPASGIRVLSHYEIKIANGK